MTKSSPKTRVVLIGGTSNVGKSTLAKSLAAQLDWHYRPTDKMARHPGFPWVGPDGQPRPDFVLEHYRTLEVEELLADVLAHYLKNVVPQVEALISEVRRRDEGRGVIIEGSALWPEFVVKLAYEDDVEALWLIAGNDLLRDRIYWRSGYDYASDDEKFVIQKFLDRTWLYNERMREKLVELGLRFMNVEEVKSPGELLRRCLGKLELGDVPPR
ncbi:2-phosphoglycerate kinase [bacterium]|nr:MAG: 2-phosphoglycerate kinase [bacterium]